MLAQMGVGIFAERYERAAEFLDVLRPTAVFWRADPTKWVFRGHANAEWKLLPSANQYRVVSRFVDGIEKRRDDELYCDPKISSIKQVIRDFAEALNHAGHPVPGRWRAINAPGFFHEELHELIGLGQHHGLPTPFLDWTRHGTHAAYFAASETEAQGVRSNDLVVWALRTDIFQGPDGTARSALVGEREACLVLATPPRAGNPNLHAQGGIFTLVDDASPRDAADDTLCPATLDDVISKFALRYEAADPRFKDPVMYRLSLPRTESDELLRWLSFEPVTGATMFPGVDGVVRGVREGKSRRQR